jgi:hypothetical protein
MRFSTSAFLAVAAAPLLAFAQGGESNGSNPFNIPTTSLNTEAGATVNLTWKPTTEGPVTIYLRSGASNNLNKGVAIASTSRFPIDRMRTTLTHILSWHLQLRLLHLERPRGHRPWL